MQRDLVLDAHTGGHDAFSALAAGAVSRLHRTARLILTILHSIVFVP
jgi:hypothetical protein